MKTKFTKVIFIMICVVLSSALFSLTPVYATGTANFNLSTMTVQNYRPDNSYIWSPYSILSTNGSTLSAYSTGSTWSGLYLNQSVWTHVNLSYSLSLPDNIRVTEAKLMMYGYRDGENSSSWFTKPYLNGQYYAGSTGLGWFSTDATNWFSLFSGGSITASQTFDLAQVYTGNPYGSGSYSFSESTSIYLYNGSFPPYLQVKYEFCPATPVIYSPVAGSNNKNAVTLSAGSTVTGGASITYFWEYSLDGATNWTSICSTTSTSVNWTIPMAIPENSSVFVRCRAVASGVSSVYSAAIRFNKADDPAISAKLAAEAAEAKAEEARATVNAMNTKMNEIYAIINTDTEGPAITHFSYLLDQVNVVRNNVEIFLLYAVDNKTPANQLEYRYKVNAGAYSSWAVLSGPEISVNLGNTAGYKRVLIEVRDLSGNITAKTKGIFKLGG